MKVPEGESLDEAYLMSEWTWYVEGVTTSG